MERFLVRWAFNVAALWVAAKLLSGVSVSGDQFFTLVLAGLVLGLANMVVKPVLVILALPLIVLTLGIAYFLVNVAIVFFTSWIVSGFHVDGFWSGVGAALIVWGVNVLLERLARRFEHAPQP
jgi:putative membrane protein